MTGRVGREARATRRDQIREIALETAHSIRSQARPHARLPPPKGLQSLNLVNPAFNYLFVTRASLGRHPRRPHLSPAVSPAMATAIYATRRRFCCTFDTTIGPVYQPALQTRDYDSPSRPLHTRGDITRDFSLPGISFETNCSPHQTLFPAGWSEGMGGEDGGRE